MITILKFFSNTDKRTEQENEIISRTLLKIAVISRHYRQRKGPAAMSASGELWRCKVVKEIGNGKNKGCFIVEPLEPITDDKIVHLIPGLYSKQVLNGRLMVYPTKKGTNWIMPLVHKRLLADEHQAYCVIVRLDNPSPDEDKGAVVEPVGDTVLPPIDQPDEE